MEIAGKLEAATGPDRNLDAMMHHCINVGTGYRAEAPAYTASLDAAMTLLPNDVGWTSWSVIGKRPCVATQVDGSFGSYSGGHTLPLALCAAAFKVRALASEALSKGGG